MNILENIIIEKKKEIACRISDVPITSLKKMSCFDRECYSFADSLKCNSRSKIITEFKRKSPSKNWINQFADVVDVTTGYTANGAVALSVLTDEQFFGGSLFDLQQARINEIPILRKDFIVDEYQLAESKAFGADIILLIAACLSKAQILQISKTAKDLGLNVLLEIHEESEIDFINQHVDVVGINNRNLKTFEVDVEYSIRLAEKLPGVIKISESGLSDMETVDYLVTKGFAGFLIGESFMKHEDPAEAFKNFLNSSNEN